MYLFMFRGALGVVVLGVFGEGFDSVLVLVNWI